MRTHTLDKIMPVLVTIMATWLMGPANGVAHEHTLPAIQKKKRAEQSRHLALAQNTISAKKELGECRLTITLRDAETNKSLPANVRVTRVQSDEPLELMELIRRPNGWYAMPARGVVTVPQAELAIEAVHGLETELAREVINLHGREEALVQLRAERFYNAAARKLRSGNTHLHLNRISRKQADRYLRVVPRADGLDLLYVSYLLRAMDDLTYITNSYSAEDLARLSDERILFGYGQEHRHNFEAYGEGYGHVMFLDIRRLVQPVSIGPGIMKTGSDGIPLRRGITTARQDGASVIWCHNTFGVEDIPNWVTGVVDAQNIFDGGNHGSYKDSFYRYLNLGLRVPFSTGTDWFIYDFSRVYIPLEGPLSSQRWLRELAAGRSFITNGTFLELDVAGRAAGDTITLSGPADLGIHGRGIGRNNFRSLELIFNGDVVHSLQSKPERGHFVAEMDFSLQVDQPGWVALRIGLETDKNELREPLFAHTSPVYIEMAGKKIFQPFVAQEMIAEIERSMSLIKSKGTFFADEEKEAVLNVYRNGIANLRDRLKRGG